MRFLFWTSAVGLFYVYLGYPLILWALVKLKKRLSGESIPVTSLENLPPCSVVISSYNEAALLKAKIESVLATEPQTCIGEILVASDGSSDDTADVLNQFKDARIRTFIFEQRRGKPSILNELVPEAQFDLVVLTDARQELEPYSVPRLLARFADHRVGVVSGELVFRSVDESGVAGEGMNVYWHYEKFIRNLEGELASVPGATGALYALRKELYDRIPSTVLLDDVAIPMQAIFQKTRCVFEAGAVAYDKPSTSAEKEGVRKRRTLAGNIQLLKLYPKILIPFRNPIWLQYMSHKVGRLFSPFWLIICLLSSLLLIGSPIYWFCFAVQLLFYVTALVGYVLQEFNRRSRWASAAFMFVALNGSTLLAWSDALRGRFQVTWDRSDKEQK